MRCWRILAPVKSVNLSDKQVIIRLTKTIRDPGSTNNPFRINKSGEHCHNWRNTKIAWEENRRNLFITLANTCTKDAWAYMLMINTFRQRRCGKVTEMCEACTSKRFSNLDFGNESWIPRKDCPSACPSITPRMNFLLNFNVGEDLGTLIALNSSHFSVYSFYMISMLKQWPWNRIVA